MTIAQHQVYALIGDQGFERLVAAFYRQVAADPILAPMYPAKDMSGAEQRLKSFLVYRFGGPPTYIADRGHPRLRLRHAPFKIDDAARSRWVELMNRSLVEAALPPEAVDTLQAFFSETAAFLQNQV